MVDQLLYKPTEAATALATSRSKVFELLRTGELDSVTLGKRRLIPKESLLAYVEGLKDKADARERSDHALADGDPVQGLVTAGPSPGT